MWVILSNQPAGNGHRKYVNQPGRKKSFTTCMRTARTFSTKEAAQAQCCGDEHPVPKDR